MRTNPIFVKQVLNAQIKFFKCLLIYSIVIAIYLVTISCKFTLYIKAKFKSVKIIVFQLFHEEIALSKTIH